MKVYFTILLFLVPLIHGALQGRYLTLISSQAATRRVPAQFDPSDPAQLWTVTLSNGNTSITLATPLVQAPPAYAVMGSAVVVNNRYLLSLANGTFNGKDKGGRLWSYDPSTNKTSTASVNPVFTAMDISSKPGVCFGYGHKFSLTDPVQRESGLYMIDAKSLQVSLIVDQTKNPINDNPSLAVAPLGALNRKSNIWYQLSSPDSSPQLYLISVIQRKQIANISLNSTFASLGLFYDDKFDRMIVAWSDLSEPTTFSLRIGVLDSRGNIKTLYKPQISGVFELSFSTANRQLVVFGLLENGVGIATIDIDRLALNGFVTNGYYCAHTRFLPSH